MSCCQCLKIKVLSPPAGVPSQYLENGELFLDLPADFNLEFSKALGELSEIDKIKDEATLAATLPQTPRNKAFFDYLKSFTRIGNTFDTVDVLVMEGSVTHNFTLLALTNSSDAAKTYEVQIKRGSSHWLTLAEKTYLAELDFGTFEFTFDNIVAYWAGNFQYIDGDAGIWFPLVHYGSWFKERTVVVEDMRPWHHMLAVLQKSFCAIGWDFRCPFLETDEGRQIGVYILGESYGSEDTTVESRKFRAHIETNPIETNPLLGLGIYQLPFEVEDYDPGGNYNPTTGEFSGVGIFNFKASLDVEFTIFTGSGPNPTYTVILYRHDPVSMTDEEVTKLTGPIPNGGGLVHIDFEAESVSIVPGQTVFIGLFTSDGIVSVIGYFYNEPERATYTRGDIIDIAGVIDPEMTILDFFKGVVHLLNGKIKTDWVNSVVWLYTPYDTEWQTNLIDGFYTDDIIDLTAVILDETEEVSITKEQRARYCLLKYKDSSDAFVEKNNLEQENAPLYSKLVDLGAGIEETENKENPLFEPTVNAKIDKFPDIPPLTINYSIDIPHLWDNTEGKQSFKIKPRLCFFYGYAIQQDPDASGLPLAYWRFDNFVFDKVPYAYQVPNMNIYLVGALTPMLLYGEDTDDFYNVAWKRDLHKLALSARVAYDGLVSTVYYKSIDFRPLHRIYYDGRTILARMIEVNNRQSCSDAPAQLVFVPEPFVGDYCADIISVPADPCASNQPRIFTSADIGAGTLTATADDSGIVSPIDTDTWEYSTDNGSSWLSYTPSTPVAPAPGETKVIFRRTVTFSDGCYAKVVTRTGDFAVSCSNNPTISITYDEGINTATATGGGDFNSSIDTDTWTVSLDDGAPVAYTPGDPVDNFEKAVFTRTVTFTNACPDITVTQTLEIEPPVCNNRPDLSWIEVSDCVYDLQVSGTVDSTICMTVIEISTDSGVTWQLWDNVPARAVSGLKARATFLYCDQCPASFVEKDCPLL